jgi:GNAT superfamily N-acetyltransferase
VHLFSSAINNHKLKFIKLANAMEHLDLAAQWAEGEWGYIRNKGVDYRKSLLTNLKNNIYIGLLNSQPVAMFALFDKDMEPEFNQLKNHKPLYIEELMYVYVDKRCRDLGFGRQIMNEVKRLSKQSKSDYVMLDTLKPSLNGFYARRGAKVIAENQLFQHATDVMVIDSTH